MKKIKKKNPVLRSLRCAQGRGLGGLRSWNFDIHRIFVKHADHEKVVSQDAAGIDEILDNHELFEIETRLVAGIREINSVITERAGERNALKHFESSEDFLELGHELVSDIQGVADGENLLVNVLDGQFVSVEEILLDCLYQLSGRRSIDGSDDVCIIRINLQCFDSNGI